MYVYPGSAGRGLQVTKLSHMCVLWGTTATRMHCLANKTSKAGSVLQKETQHLPHTVVFNGLMKTKAQLCGQNIQKLFGARTTDQLKTSRLMFMS